MTKQEIISLVRGFTLREDANQRFHENFLVSSIGRVLIEMYNDLYKTNPRALDRYTKVYGVPTPLTVLNEAGSGIYYLTLPVSVIPLPSKASGVLHIYPAIQSGNIFQPMDATEADLVFNTDVAVVSSKIGYRVRQDSRVDFWNMSAAVIASGVRADLLIHFRDYADTDEVAIPELSEKEGGSFLSRVLPLLGVVPPADLSDSNSPAKEQNNKQ
jgi:hypothetical protein